MVDLADAPVVAVLTRAPSRGGKTRLFRDLKRPADPGLLEALLLDTIDGIRAAGVVTVVAVDPPDASDEIRRLVPPDVVVIAQGAGSLGERMGDVMARVLERGARAVVLVGSDLPGIAASVIRQAFMLLETTPDGLILGPAADGGYYLIAATHVPHVFDGIPWGTGAVLAETVKAARRIGLAVHLLPSMADVDTGADLERLMSQPPGRPSRTVEWARAEAQRRRPR